MTLDQVKATLLQSGLVVSSEARTNNDLGWQLRLQNGAIVNVFDNGTCNVQGKSQQAVKDALSLNKAKPVIAGNGPPGSVSGPPKVFVVYGHDGQARTDLEAMLRRWGLEPLILDQLPSEGQTII